MEAARIRPFVVTVGAGPRPRSASIRLVGDVDMRGEPALADAVEYLLRSGPDVVVVDLSAVTFVCSTFANFVADVHAAVPDASLILHSPSLIARHVLAVTGLDTLVTMPDEVLGRSSARGDQGGAGRLGGNVLRDSTLPGLHGC